MRGTEHLAPSRLAIRQRTPASSRGHRASSSLAGGPEARSPLPLGMGSVTYTHYTDCDGVRIRCACQAADDVGSRLRRVKHARSTLKVPAPLSSTPAPFRLPPLPFQLD